MFDSWKLRARRSIAWERARTEIQDILGQFWGLEEFQELDQLVKEFAEKFEALAAKGLPSGVGVLAKNAMPDVKKEKQEMGSVYECGSADWSLANTRHSRAVDVARAAQAYVEIWGGGSEEYRKLAEAAKKWRLIDEYDMERLWPMIDEQPIDYHKRAGAFRGVLDVAEAARAYVEHNEGDDIFEDNSNRYRELIEAMNKWRPMRSREASAIQVVKALDVVAAVLAYVNYVETGSGSKWVRGAFDKLAEAVSVLGKKLARANLDALDAKPPKFYSIEEALADYEAATGVQISLEDLMKETKEE